MEIDLTPRMIKILEAVIESYVAEGRPVGSRRLMVKDDFGLAASTLRSELARLEKMGYLDHPHTSAGRVPTDKGYRFYVDNTARRRRHQKARAIVDFQENGAQLFEGELEDTLRRAAGILARTTGLLALVSAPSQDNTAIRHVEVLKLHSDLVMVMVITTSGGVAKKLIVFENEVDSGLVEWARGFLNEALCGMDLGSRRLKNRLEEPKLSAAEAGFVRALAPAFLESGSPDRGLYMEGASRFFTRLEEDGSSKVRHLMELLDRQDEILGLLREALDEQRIYLRIGRELPRRAMSGLSLVAANYGVAHRNLGTVGVLGPTRMNYPAVIGSVQNAAWALSRFVEEIYQ